MIVNRCKDVVIRLRQMGPWASRLVSPTLSTGSTSHPLATDPWRGWDEVAPNANVPMPFAWDEPSQDHKVKVVAHAMGIDARQVTQQVGREEGNGAGWVWQLGRPRQKCS